MPFVRHNFDEVSRDLGNLIQRYANRVMADVDKAMVRQSILFGADLKEGSPVDSGDFKRAWREVKVGYAHYEWRNDTPYGVIIETGGYLGVGPKTAQEGPQTFPGGISVGGGIFPRQVPSHPVARAISKRTTEVREELGKVLRQS